MTTPRSRLLEALSLEHLRKGNTLRFRATGGSMFPLIRSGDILHVHPAEHHRLGDVLLRVQGNNWIAHRLIRHTRDAEGLPRLILRGDALPAPDPPVPPETVLGRIVGIERKGQIRSPDGLLGMVYRTLSWIPFLRYPILPWAYAFLARAKWLLLRPEHVSAPR